MLSERVVVEIIDKVMKLGLINLFYSSDGQVIFL